MEPLDDLDPLAYVFPEEDGFPAGVSVLASATARLAPRLAPRVASPFDPLLGPVFRAFERAGVRWCLLPLAWETAPEGGHEDLVALVDRGDMGAARGILTAQGFAQLPAWGSAPRFVGYDPQTDVWVALEIVTQVAYGSPVALETGAEQGCLERRRWDAGIFVLAADDEFWTLLLGMLFGGRPRDPRVLARLERLAIEARTDGPLARLTASLLPHRWTPVHVVDCVWEEDWETLERLVPAMRAAWTRQGSGATRRRRIANRILQRIAEADRVPLRRGFSVALLAPDPAAKAALAKELGRTFFIPVTYVRMSAPPRRRRGGSLARAGFFKTLVTQAQRYGVGRLRKARGRVVIFDRYTYDWRVPPVRRVPALGRLRRLVLGRSVPAPDLVVFLDAPAAPRLRLAQHGEVVPGPQAVAAGLAVQARRDRYLALSQRLPDAIVVDAGSGPDHLRREVTDRIWRAYAAAAPPAWLRPVRALAAALSRR